MVHLTAAHPGTTRRGKPMSLRDWLDDRKLRSVRPSCEALEGRITPAQIFWNVDADGFWDVAANWRDDQGHSRVPGAGDDVVIDRPAGDFTVTFRDPAQSVRSITARERLVL